ncbi:Short-chain dehydrogenase/reductase SDR family and Glucose/ribitol dehydrogenase family and NAD(P)-binding domain-containing protein [Strongyloides ratti]|uniref:Short-chain dehydrogenase/reductase SDR family and Glucose/ribitol dehydrogenase family and NAD(P)-binding domain-containing protein n=1 Tax=Strongyloides ratti TaxID=34506 RepID=A0A090MUR8_STRRB|nr:Short-chain dehydrogenase/reductase SDR family and Glucose/ribitol dehydrogenase family and NAD(P)-binding domain-containing protein [Strongyloides ratti]CEF62393.1 Short-chain dehydrogenase/reductase SDR family and Glucose/ribitol dehydrogenase family and NAD(P)-binding domain-containing protein [Strongyloides ratti]
MWFIIVTILVIIIGIRKFLEILTIDDIKGKVVVITGCDSGFGYETAIKCCQNGMIVFGGCLTNLGATELEKRCNKMEGKLFTFIVDVSDDDSMKSGCEKVKQIMKKLLISNIYGLIVNAGILGDCGPFDWLSTKNYKDVFEVNTFGGIRTVEHFKELIKKSNGRIIITTSVCGRVAIPNIGPYSCSKYAMEAFCDILRLEMKPFNVKVICIEPGFFKTPLTKTDNITKMLERVYNNCSDNIKQQYGKDYFNFIVKQTKEHLIYRSSSNCHLVSEAYFRSLVSYLPYSRYQIGFDSKYVFIPLSFIPTEISDLLAQLFMLIKGAPKIVGINK